MDKKIEQKEKKGIKTKIKEILINNKNKKQEKMLKKLNPLFLEEFNSENFHTPNIVHIVDDAVRRDNDLCQGAIGWREKIADTEVLFLYDEFIEQSKIKFIPTATCDSSYYIDNHNRNRYIRIDCLFSKAHEEKVAELKHIAFSLGAKKCSIQINEQVSESSNKDIAVNAKKNSVKKEINNLKQESRQGKDDIIFEGNNTPTEPTLKWFADNDNIKRLIDIRLSGNNSIKSEVLEISGSSTATISQKTAISIDNFMKKFGKVESNIKSSATKESNSTLIFKIEF